MPITPEPLLILTTDDHLAERWQGLADRVLHGRQADALDAWRRDGHRLVVTDLALGGPEAPLWESAAWKRSAQGLLILAASSTPSEDEGLAVMRAGASGYCHSHGPLATLRQALEVIASGELWVGRALLSRLLRLVDSRLPRTGLSDWATELTDREREVAHHAAIGASNAVIADTLGITERTVKAHLKAVFEKLGLEDRLQLALRVHGIR